MASRPDPLGSVAPSQLPLRQAATIRRATVEDFPRINQIYAQAREFMVRAGNPTQWAGGYPQQAMLDDDVARGNLYVCGRDVAGAGESIDAVFYFGIEEDATYAVIDDGSWLNDAEYGVVHRIAVAEGTRGLGSFCIQWALDRTHELGVQGGLRIDTHASNAPMRGLLANKLGFTACGTIYTYDGSPRIAYQHL